MTMELSVPAPLTLAHNTSLFSRGEAVPDDWLRGRAIKNEASGASLTYVVCCKSDVVGYYSLSTGSIEHQFAPGNIKLYVNSINYTDSYNCSNCT